MAWTRLPAKTDPLMTQSMRTDFPAPLERQIVDGGVREGRPETTQFPGMVSLVFLLVLGLAALGIALKWLVFGFP